MSYDNKNYTKVNNPMLQKELKGYLLSTIMKDYYSSGLSKEQRADIMAKEFVNALTDMPDIKQYKNILNTYANEIYTKYKNEIDKSKKPITLYSTWGERNGDFGPKITNGGARQKASKTTRKPATAKKKSSSKPAAATGKVRAGPRGGKFVLRNGHKVYV